MVELSECKQCLSNIEFKDMKQFILVSFLLLLNVAGEAQSILFETNIDTAFAKARRENKIVFVEYYSKSCHVCQTIATLMENPKVSEFYNQNFINYKINVDPIAPEDQQFMDSSGIKPPGIPVFFFFSASKKFIHFAMPPQDPNALIFIAKIALDPNERVESIEKKYRNGDHSYKTLTAYSSYLQMIKSDSMIHVIADELYSIFPKDQMNSKKSYLTMRSFVQSIDNGFYRYWYAHRDSMINFEEGKYKGRELETLKNILTRSINSVESKKWNMQKVAEAKTQMVALDSTVNPDLFTWEREAQLFIEANNRKSLMDLCEKMLLRKNGNLKGDIYIIEQFLKLALEENELRKINDYIEERLQKPECTGVVNCNFTYLKAKYLVLINEMDSAKLFFNKAISCAKNNPGMDVSKFSELVNKLK